MKADKTESDASEMAAQEDGAMMKDKDDVMMKPAEKSYGSGTKDKPATYGSGTKSEDAVMMDKTPENCPAGTKAQADGTCMLEE